ncbi:MAG: LLM class flavin-dependent oxidoreductase [Chloroflexota bacterium]
MQFGIHSFAAHYPNPNDDPALARANAMNNLLDRMVLAEEVGLDAFGIGEHYREEFLDSANTIILAAAAARTKRIKLTSAVTVLSAADPVRVFQNFATLDLISRGRAEIVVGRGSFTESFPLFGLDLRDYDALFAEKLGLLLQIRDSKTVTWSGKFRPALNNQAIFPRPLQEKIPIWLGVGGTPGSFARAGMLGLPLMVAVIGGQTHRFRPLVDLYRQAGERAGHAPETLKVGLHSLGFVADSSKEAVEAYYPGYAEGFTRIGRERGWPPVTRAHFDAQNDELGALLVGNPEEIAAKIMRHSAALGGIDHISLQMINSGLSHKQLMRSIELLGTRVAPLVNKG